MNNGMIVNEVRTILRAVAILLVMVGVLSATVASCNAMVVKRITNCCAGDVCKSVAAGGDVMKDSGQVPAKGPCTDCTVFCKAVDRSMAPMQAVMVDLPQAERVVVADGSVMVPAGEHLSGVFKPPRA